MSTTDFLLEIGTCELPPGDLSALGKALAENIKTSLDEFSLLYENVDVFFTPRRLAVLIRRLAIETPRRTIEVKGPSVKLAFKDGQPTNAAFSFANNYKVTVDQLVKRETYKGEYLFFVSVVDGIKVENILPDLIENSVKALPLRKAMFWGNGCGPFVRPVRWVMALLGNRILPINLFGNVVTSNFTFGHRFLHEFPIFLDDPKKYEKQLNDAFVIVDYEKRREQIEVGLKKLRHVKIDQDLLDEVTNLVEYPVVLEGKFDEKFLELPPEIIQITLKSYQKCFVEVDDCGKLMARFAIISNLLSKDYSVIIKGNEKVVKARLSDAKYFYEEDKKISLENRIGNLYKVVFYQGLGSLADKAERINRLLEELLVDEDKELKKKVAWLAKSDLSTMLVGEFPELQGVVGYYLYKDENMLIANAIKDHYLPRFSEDVLPSGNLSIALALADRLDTLTGIFILGKKISGDGDPLGARRIALAIIRLILHWKKPLNLRALLGKSLTCYNHQIDFNLVEEIVVFILDRLVSLYTKYSSIFRVVVCGNWGGDLLVLDGAMQALIDSSSLPWLTSYRRVSNILMKNSPIVGKKVDTDLLKSEEEKELWGIFCRLSPLLDKKWQDSKYLEYLDILNEFTEPLDRFFATTMVLVSDVDLQNNRLFLLQKILALFTRYGAFENIHVD